MIDRIFRVCDWIGYVFGWGRRRAWCEITGGHDNQILGAWAGDRATAIKLHCYRCGRETGWMHLTKRPQACSVAPHDGASHD
jgi:hypothetical protein